MATETMTITTTTTTTPLLLTSGASGRVNALLSLRALKSLVLIIKAFVFFLLLFPFQLGRTSFSSSRRSPSISSGSSSSGSSSSPSSPDDHHHHDGNKKKKRKHHDISPSPSPAAAATIPRFTPNKNPFFLRPLPTPPSSPDAASSMAVAVVPYHEKNNSVGGGDLDASTRRTLAIRRATPTLDPPNQDVIRDVSLFLTSRGDTLFTQTWTPAPPTNIRGVVVLLHGLNEHSGRYDAFARKLNANGYKVYGMDWIGHGGSDGLHGYVHSLDYAVDDMKAFVEKIVTENPGLPCFCFAHSTGAAIVLKTILDPRIKVLVKGVVLTSPAVRVQPSHPIFKVLAPIFSFLLPRYQFQAANKNGTCVSRDAEALIAKYTDPLVYTGSIRVRTGYEILRISAYLQQQLSRLTTPFLVLHGAADAVTDPEASQELHEKASSADKSIKLYQGLLHDILFEPEKEIVTNDIIEWLNSRV